MAILGWDELYQSADKRRPELPVAVAGGNDRTVLEAISEAAGRGWIQPVLHGSREETRRIADECSIDLASSALVDSDKPAATAVAEVRRGRAQLLMKGRVATPELMHAILDPDQGLRMNRTICQVVMMEVQPSGRRFLLADTGICIQPTLDQKIEILQSAALVAHRLGSRVPAIAMMAATESVTASMPDTQEAAEIARRNQNDDLPGCVVQGPLSFDLAYAADAGDKKRIEGPVVGNADVMIFPDLLSANLTVKAIMYTAPCRFGGVLCGGACPVVFMSRADTAATRLNSIALALALADVKEKDA